MTSNSNKARRWRTRKIDEGYKRVTMWLEPDIGKLLDHEAFCEMVPAGVAAEMIVKKHFAGEK